MDCTVQVVGEGVSGRGRGGEGVPGGVRGSSEHGGRCTGGWVLLLHHPLLLPLHPLLPPPPPVLSPWTLPAPIAACHPLPQLHTLESSAGAVMSPVRRWVQVNPSGGAWYCAVQVGAGQPQGGHMVLHWVGGCRDPPSAGVCVVLHRWVQPNLAGVAWYCAAQGAG